MDLSFYKLRLCDSDIILVDDLAGNGRDRAWEAIARAMLHRRRGAGADRLVVVSKPEDELRLRAFGRLGEGGPLADAALCAARYLLDAGRSGTETVRMRIPGGELSVDVLDSSSLGLSLGPPRGMPGGEALDADAAAARAASVEAAGERYRLLPLRAGLPPADATAVFADGGAARARARITSSSGGRAPSVVAVRVASRDELIVSAPVDEGIDRCAAGAVALAAAAAVGYSDREALVRLGREAVWVEWAAGGALYVAARPTYVYRGEFHIEEAEG
jgi:diaminopimelate epimerase